MKQIKTILVVSCFMLLSFFSFSCLASDVELENAIGVHNFDLSSGDLFNSTGSFIVRNKANEVAHIILTVGGILDSRDLDEDGNPRIHKHQLLRENITFHGLLNINWIQLNTHRFDVEPYSSYLVEYKVLIPRDELPYYTNTTNGFLGYIEIDGEGGQKVSCKYDAKIFFTFQGELAQPFMLPNFILWFVAIAVVFSVISYLVIVSKKKSHSTTSSNDIYE